MTAFLDTCVVIDALDGGKPHYRARLEEVMTEPGGIVISAFVLHELVYGAMIRKRPDVELALVDRFVERAHVEPWTAEDAIAAGRVRADMRATGTPVGAVDSLIAGQALNRGWNIVTSNIKDFIRIPDLTVIDWSDPAGARLLDAATWRADAVRLSKDPK